MDISSIYSARLTFYRDLKIVKIEARPFKIGRKLEKKVDIPERKDLRIDIGELHWELIRNKYMKGRFAIYERKEDNQGSPYYINSSREIPHESLNQKLEKLLEETLRISFGIYIKY